MLQMQMYTLRICCVWAVQHMINSMIVKHIVLLSYYSTFFLVTFSFERFK